MFQIIKGQTLPQWEMLRFMGMELNIGAINAGGYPNDLDDWEVAQEKIKCGIWCRGACFITAPMLYATFGMP